MSEQTTRDLDELADETDPSDDIDWREIAKLLVAADNALEIDRAPLLAQARALAGGNTSAKRMIDRSESTLASK